MLGPAKRDSHCDDFLGWKAATQWVTAAQILAQDLLVHSKILIFSDPETFL